MSRDYMLMVKRTALLLFVLMIGFAYAARFELNKTYELRAGLHPDGIYVDGQYIYVWYSDDRLVYRYYIDQKTAVLRTSKSFGSIEAGAEDYMSYIADVWVDSNYLYVLDKGGKVFKFDKSTGDLKFKGDSDSYRPAGPAAIAAYNDNIYLLDREKGQVNILNQYSENRYIFKSSISWNYLGIADAVFKSPEDLFVDEDGTLYIADTDNNRIAVFSSNGTYIRSIGRGSSGTTLSEPQAIALDKDYLYVIQNKKKSIEVLLRKDDKVVYSIDNSTFEFDKVSGVFASGEQAYAVDYNADLLIIFYLNKSSLLEEKDVLPLYNETYSDVQSICTLLGVANDLNIDVIDRCTFYRSALDLAATQINESKYDLAYSTLKGIGPQLEGDLSYVGPQVRAVLSDESATLRNQTQTLVQNLTGQLRNNAYKILLQLDDVDNYISKGDYLNAHILLKELEVRYGIISKTQGAQQDVENERITNYATQLEEANATYIRIRPELDYYHVPYDAKRIEYLINTTGKDIEMLDLDIAYSKLNELISKLSDAESLLNTRKALFSDAQQSIESANNSLQELLNSTKTLPANTSLAEELIENASRVLYTDPALAKQYADNASALISAQKKEIENANFLTMTTAAVIVFAAIVISLIIIGIKRILGRGRQWG